MGYTKDMALLYPTRYQKERTGNSYLSYYKPHKVYHPGVDFNYGFGDEDKDQPIICPASGVVEYVSPKGTNGGLGNYLVVCHPELGVWTRYLHLDDIVVTIGQSVKQGELIGHLGDTGTATAHLHFEVLNRTGLDWIKYWNRPYGRYPSGLSKVLVASMWLDPIAWLQQTTDVIPPALRLTQANTALKWAKGLRRAMLERLIERLKKML